LDTADELIMSLRQIAMKILRSLAINALTLKPKKLWRTQSVRHSSLDLGFYSANGRVGFDSAQPT